MNTYPDQSANLIYNLIFCDDIEWYKTSITPPYSYPFDILFSSSSSISDLQKIIDDVNTELRTKILAYNQQRKLNHVPTNKELLGVIVEVGLDGGLDTLAVYVDGTARYINQSGRLVIWDTTDAVSNEMSTRLFAESRKIVDKIGPWTQPRRPRPEEGDVRITFLVSDGLYFGEGPMDVLFEDPMAALALDAATELLQYITNKAMQ